MPNDKRLCLVRTSISVALVASILGLSVVPSFAQSKDTNDGVTVEKNADGSVDAYDSGDSAEGLSDGNGTMQDTGKIHYRAGTSPYQKKFSDGTSVRRNSDGSIETWDEGETQHFSATPSSGGHRRSVKRKATTTKAKATTTVKKKSK